jgi:isopenicillin N synthase-like dioxygenase
MAPVLDPPQTVDWMGKKVPVWPVPTINYGLLLSQDPSEVDKVVNACLEEGYFYLDLQGIDGRRMLADQQETLKLMKRFFDAPLEAKNEFGLISSHLGCVFVISLSLFLSQSLG